MNILGRIRRKLYKWVHPELGVVLMLHRVTEKRSCLTPNRDIEITPAYLESVIVDYKKRGYRFVSLHEVYEVLSGRKKRNGKFVCITFDDGYADNLECAYPVLKRHNCPFAIYVASDFVEGKAFLWWYVLEDILMEHEELRLSDGTVRGLRTMAEKHEIFNEIHKLLRPLPPPLLKEAFESLFKNYTFSVEQKVEDLSLSREQVKWLAMEGLCTIGAHTLTHPSLDSLTAAEQKAELMGSKTFLERLTNKPVEHFAYPYGAYNADSLNEVEQCGYKTAVMAWGGAVRRGQSVYQIQRNILKQD